MISSQDLKRHVERAHELRAQVMRQMARAAALFVAVRIARAKRRALKALTRAKEGHALRGAPPTGRVSLPAACWRVFSKSAAVLRFGAVCATHHRRAGRIDKPALERIFSACGL